MAHPPPMSTTSSASTTAPCPAARSSCASPTAPSSAPRCTPTPTPSSSGPCRPTSPAPSARCRRSGRCRCPRTTARCCASPCPLRSPPRASTRRRSSASPPTSPPARWSRRSPTAPRSTRSTAWPTGRTPTSSSGSTTPPRTRPTASTSSPHERREPWLPRYGGLISSEWEFAKGLQLFEEDRELYDRMEHWVEAADWIVWQLCGTYVRNACTAGYKGTPLARRRLPDAGVPRRALAGLRRPSSPTSSSTRSASSATGRAR